MALSLTPPPITTTPTQRSHATPAAASSAPYLTAGASGTEAGEKRGLDVLDSTWTPRAIKVEQELHSGGGCAKIRRKHLFDRCSSITVNPRASLQSFVPRSSAIGGMKYFAIARHRDPDMIGIFFCKFGEIKHLVTCVGEVIYSALESEAKARTWYKENNGPGDPACVDPDGGSA